MTIFSPLRVFLPIAGASFALGVAYGIWNFVTQQQHPEWLGAADHAVGRRAPDRPGVGADLGPALRWPQVAFPRSFVLAAAARRPRRAARIRPRLLGRTKRSIATKSSTCRSRAAWSRATATSTTNTCRRARCEPFGRAPGYPVFLALVGGGTRSRSSAVPASVKIAQSIVGAIGVVADRGRGVSAWRAGGPRWRRRRSPPCIPPLVWISGYAYSEAVFWPVGLGAGAASSAARSSSRAPRCGSGRSLCGSVDGRRAILLRAATLLFVPLAGALAAVEAAAARARGVRARPARSC